MVWFRVDDVLTFHPRVLEAGNAAVGLWVRAGAWSMAQLTDGHIPTSIARQLGSAVEIKRLVASGLWTQVTDGYQFHAWEGRQPTRAAVLEKRGKDRQRKHEQAEAAAEKRWRGGGDAKDSARNPDGSPTDSAAPSDASRPVPSRPDDSYVSPSSPVPDRANSTDDEATRARREAYWRGFGITNPGTVVALLIGATDRPITEDEALGVVAGIRSKAKQLPKNPQRYIESAIRQSWAEIQQEYDEARLQATEDERLPLVEAGIEPPALRWAAS